MWEVWNLDGKCKTFDFKLKAYIYKHRVDKKLIVLNLRSISINKIVVTDFITVKFSRFTESKFDTKLSARWNKQVIKKIFSKVSKYLVYTNEYTTEYKPYKNKSITENHRI